MPEFNRIRVREVTDVDQRARGNSLNLTFDLPADISIIKRDGDDYQVVNLDGNSFDAADENTECLLGDQLERELK